MEMKMAPYTIPQPITWNYEELKAALTAKAAEYSAVVYSDEQIKTAKEDRAALNRLRKALNDERIRREREYMQPFTTFKAQVAEIIAIIDKPVSAIDAQVKDYEERKKAEKRQLILDYWAQTGAPEWMHSCKPCWLNASYSMKTIQAEIDANVDQAGKDLEIIRKLPAYAFEAEEHYKTHQNLAEAVREADKLQETALRKAAYEAERAQQQIVESARKLAETVAAAATVRESQTVEPVSGVNMPPEPKREWIAFQALLTPDEAAALGQYMKAHGIQYKAV